MGLVDRAKAGWEGITKGSLTKPDTQQKTKASVGVAVSGKFPISRPRVDVLRQWAETNEWIRTAIDHRKSQVTRTDFDIMPIDTTKPYDLELRSDIMDLFNYPDLKGSSFRTLIEPTVEDLLVLDAGTIEVVYNLQGYPSQLYAADGATIRINPTWDGTSPKEPRYYWYPSGTWQASLLNEEIIYMMQRPATYRVYGLSSIEVLQNTIAADLAAARYNFDQITQTAPTGLINLGEDVSADQVTKFTSYYENEIAGRKQTGVVGGSKNPSFIPFGHSQRDMQFLEWQLYLARKVAIVFGISPQDLGLLEDANRSNSQTQRDLSEDRGIIPLLTLVQEYLNREVVAQFAIARTKRRYMDGEISLKEATNAMKLATMSPIHVQRMLESGSSDPDVTKLVTTLRESNLINLHFKFKPVNIRNAQTQAEIHQMELSKQPYKTINEVRAVEGLEPAEGGDDIIIETFVGATPLRMLGEVQGIASDNFGNNGSVATEEKPSDEPKKPKEEKEKSLRDIAREKIKELHDDALSAKLEKKYIDSD